MQEGAGVPPPRAIHALRDTFGVNYLWNGGNLFYLARILGHSKVTTTQVYLNAVSADDRSAFRQKFFNPCSVLAWISTDIE